MKNNKNISDKSHTSEDEEENEIIELGYSSNKVNNIIEENDIEISLFSFDKKSVDNVRIDLEASDDDIGDESEPVLTLPEKNKNTTFNMEEMSEYNDELKNNNEFINMSHFDEASNAGFTLNYTGHENKAVVKANKAIKAGKIIFGRAKEMDRSINTEFEKLEIEDYNPYNLSPANKLHTKQTNEVEGDLDIVKFYRKGTIDDLIKVMDNTNKEIGTGTSDQINLNDQIEYDKNIENISMKEIIKKEVVKIISKENKNTKYTLKKIEPAFVPILIPISIPKTFAPIVLSNFNIMKICEDELLNKYNNIKYTNAFQKFLFKNPDLKSLVNHSTNTNPTEKKKEKVAIHLNQLNTNEMNFMISNNNLRTSYKQTNLTPLNKSPIKAKYNETDLNRGDNMVNKFNEEIKTLKINHEKSLNDVERKYFIREKEYEELREKYSSLLVDYEENESRTDIIISKNNKILHECDEKQNIVDNLHSQIIQKEEMVNKYVDDNFNLKSQIDSMKKEMNSLRNETVKKNGKISEMQQENLALEQELNDIRSRSNNEMTNLRENKQNLDSLKSNYYEIKNQYELMSMKYQSIADDNFNIKRDLLLYDKEIKNKNEMIEKLRRENIESNKKSFLGLGEISNSNSGSNLNLNLNLHNILKTNSTYDNYQTSNDDYTENMNNMGNGNGIKKSLSKKEIYEKHLNEFNNENTTLKATKNKESNFLPNQNINNEKENMVRNIENQMHILNREREFVTAELNKVPQFPKKKDQIIKRKELEDKIENYGKDLAKLKVQLRDLNAVNREF